MDKRKIAKRPRKADAQYTQELLVKSTLLNIRYERNALGSAEEDYVNRCTRTAREFITKIHDIYCRYSEQPGQKENRREYIERCLKMAGKPEKISKDSDLASLLGLTKGIVSAGNLLRDERRASIDAVCHMLLALGWVESGNIQTKETDNKATLSKAAVREPRKRFVSYVPQNSTAQGEQLRAAAIPFGYWLPEKADDEMREALFKNTILAATSLIQKKAAKSTSDDGEQKSDYPPGFGWYVWLTPQNLSTLRNPQGAWAHNANKLHFIIAACKNTMDAQTIEKAYHAFGLHPQGMCNKQHPGDLELYRRPDFPVDQVVCASIAYFWPLITCVKTKDFTVRMSAFWGLLYAQLDYYDEGDIFRDTKLGLRDQLFFNVHKTDEAQDPVTGDQYLNPLDFYTEIYKEIEFIRKAPEGNTNEKK